MSYFSHAFKQVHLGTHDSVAQAAYNGQTNLLEATAIDYGFVTTAQRNNVTHEYIHSGDLVNTTFGMGVGCYAFFDPNTYRIVTAGDLGGTCCPLVLASTSLMSADKIGPFHGGYQESSKSKIINPKYITKLYRVDPCVPRQHVISIGTTPYTSQNVGGIDAFTTLVAGTNYTNNTYTDVRLEGGTGVGATANVTVAGTVVTVATVNNPGVGYTDGDVLTFNTTDLPHSAPGVDGGVTVDGIVPMIAADASCCKEFLCGETYYLRIDIKGSPTLRALHHNAYMTVDAYTGCCTTEDPAPVDPTLVYLGWANNIIRYPHLSAFVMPVVFDYTGVAWYAPGTTVTLDGTATPVTPAQWWGTAAGLIDNYTASVQAAAWTEDVTPTATCSAGMRLFGAYVDTRFQNCSFQVTDHYEKEPVKLLASLVDYTGDPCTFEGLCVYTECQSLAPEGLGETVLRDIILSESYKQNHVNDQNPRIREITLGDDILNSVTRSALYTKYYIQHSVPRFNNPTGVFDNDQYLLEIVTEGQSTALETFLAAWVACGSCVDLEVFDCDTCVLAPDAATE